MIASAPGKLVLSGAYVVLDGAPAVVTAVDRRAVADASRRADFVSPELRAAFGDSAPFVDSSALRQDDRKLGLGSSAATLVAALGARALAMGQALSAARLEQLGQEALAAHRSAQGGGSGIDVMASTHGGTLICRVEPGGQLVHAPARLPEQLEIEVWSCPESASTASMLGPVRELRRNDPARYRSLTEPAHQGAIAVEQALREGDAAGALVGFEAQARAMVALGTATGVPIFPAYLRELRQLQAPDAVVAQSGAGGGDVALHVSLGPSGAAWRAEAERRGLRWLGLGLQAPGLQADVSG